MHMLCIAPGELCLYMNFSPLSPFMWARVVKKYTSETVGNTFSPVRPGLTGEKVPTLVDVGTGP